MRQVVVTLTFGVANQVSDSVIHSIAGDAFVQVDEAVIRRLDGGETPVATYDVNLKVDIT